MSAPRLPMFCPSAAAAKMSTLSPVRAVSSTITTASAPSGRGAPVAISAHVPVATVARDTWPVKIRSITRSRFGVDRDAPVVSAATTA